MKITADAAPDGVKCGGHDGADFFLVNAFTKAVASGDRSESGSEGEVHDDLLILSLFM